ncbi:hypothetical protein [Shewanella gelidimarina]|nr:hypothetical protein [Shewanella gelidimarina]
MVQDLIHENRSSSPQGIGLADAQYLMRHNLSTASHQHREQFRYL